MMPTIDTITQSNEQTSAGVPQVSLAQSDVAIDDASPAFAADLAAGEYWIGDPCYAFENHDDWLELLANSDCLENPEALIERHGKTHRVLACSTMYGDGIYEDNGGYDYPVDAGLIGIMEANTALAFGATREQLASLGRFVTFGQPTSFRWDAMNSSFRFGDSRVGLVQIETGLFPDFLEDDDLEA
jgi:hypothetical protein